MQTEYLVSGDHLLLYSTRDFLKVGNTRRYAYGECWNRCINQNPCRGGSETDYEQLIL